MTKRILSVILALLLAMTAMVACGNKNNDDVNNDKPGETQNNDVKAPVAESAVEVLDKTFDSFLNALAPAFGAANGEEIKGYFASNEMETVTETDSETGEEFTYEMPKSGPGKLDLADIDTLTAYTLFPAESVEKLESASVFFNMMNMNNGTFSAFELKDAADVDAIVATLQEKITTNMWMCGFPERYVIIKIDNFVVAAFGVGDGTNAFKDAITAAYEGAVVVHDSAL